MRYFAYGSNMNPERMIERGVSFTSRERAVLKGWRLKFNKVSSINAREGYANIERDDNSVVEGILYTIEDKDIEKLDTFEGYPKHYNRVVLKVKKDNGEEVEALVYIANPDKVKDGLKPSKEYLNHLLRGCDLLSENYCNMLRNWETLD